MAGPQGATLNGCPALHCCCMTPVGPRELQTVMLQHGHVCTALWAVLWCVASCMVLHRVSEGPHLPQSICMPIVHHVKASIHVDTNGPAACAVMTQVVAMSEHNSCRGRIEPNDYLQVCSRLHNCCLGNHCEALKHHVSTIYVPQFYWHSICTGQVSAAPEHTFAPLTVVIQHLC